MSATPGVRQQAAPSSTTEPDSPCIRRSMIGSWRFVVLSRVDQKLVRLAIGMMVLTAIFALVMAVVVFFGRMKPPSETQRQLLEWWHMCQAGLAPEYHVSISDIALSDAEAYLYQPPGSGIYTAKHKLASGVISSEPILLADALLIFGVPDSVGCLEKRTVPGKSIYWLRVIFADGQIEGDVMFSEVTHRISPETAMHTFFYYAPDTAYPLTQSIPWRGFTFVSTYADCQPS